MANPFEKTLNSINKIQNDLNGNIPTTENRNSFNEEGFTVPASYQADGNGLPAQKLPNEQLGRIRRNIITWFVPDFGAVKMFINPRSIIYPHNKITNTERTKGCNTFQYWGEDLSKMSIQGTTGSSGIEGINMLYEIYRAEQLSFDGFGLSLAANNANSGSGAAGLVDAAGSALGGLLGGGTATSQAVGSGILGGILGLNSPNTNLATQNLPSLAQLATSIEMFYDNQVFRGFFTNMTITESATNFCWDYNIGFTITQIRGYRKNYFPFHRSANQGPSADGTPNTFSGKLSK